MAPLGPADGAPEPVTRRWVSGPSEPGVRAFHRPACGAEAGASAEKRASPVPVLTAGHMTSSLGLARQRIA